MKKKIFLVDFENVHSDGLKGANLLSEDDEVMIFYSANAASISIDVAFGELWGVKSHLAYHKLNATAKNALDFQLSSYIGYLIRTAEDLDDLYNSEFYIISKDSGYDAVVTFWTDSAFVKGLLRIYPTLKRAVSITAALAPDAPAIPPPGPRPVPRSFASGTRTSPIHAARAVTAVRPVFKTPIRTINSPPVTEVSAAPSFSPPPLQVRNVTKAFVPPEEKPKIKENVSEEIRAAAKTAADLKEFHNNLVKLYGMEKGSGLYKDLRDDFKELRNS